VCIGKRGAGPERIKQYKRPTRLPTPPHFGTKRYIIASKGASDADESFKFK
jgi:hypothetical protein